MRQVMRQRLRRIINSHPMHSRLGRACNYSASKRASSVLRARSRRKPPSTASLRTRSVVGRHALTPHRRGEGKSQAQIRSGLMTKEQYDAPDSPVRINRADGRVSLPREADTHGRSFTSRKEASTRTISAKTSNAHKAVTDVHDRELIETFRCPHEWHRAGRAAGEDE